MSKPVDLPGLPPTASTPISATADAPPEGPFGIAEIMEWLPHRYPFLLIDRVLDYVPKSHLVAVKNVTVNEPFFPGHFPGLPTMPGVLMLEAMAQAAGIMVVRESGLRYQDGMILYFAGIDNVRFRRMVVPGDVLIIEARLKKGRGMLFKFTARATVNGEVACKAEMSAIARG